MNQLGLAVTLESFRIGGQTGSVPAVITREFTGKVRWAGTLGVWSQPLRTVRSIPHGGRNGGSLLGGTAHGGTRSGAGLSHGWGLSGKACNVTDHRGRHDV